MIGFTASLVAAVGSRFCSRWRRDVADAIVRAHRRRIVEEIHAEIAGSRIEHARLVVAVRQLDERVMLPQRHRFGRRRRRPGCDRRSGPAPRAGRVCHERRRDLDLRVLRKRLRVGGIDGAARAIEPVRRRPETADDAGGVAHEEIRQIDEHAPVRFGRGREAPDYRLRERLFHRVAFVRVRALRAVIVVRLDHQHFRPDPLEADDARVGETGTVDADVVRSHPGADAGDVQHFLIEFRDLEIERAGVLIPVQREEAIHPLEAFGLLGDRRELPAARLSPARGRLPLGSQS